MLAARRAEDCTIFLLLSNDNRVVDSAGGTLSIRDVRAWLELPRCGQMLGKRPYGSRISTYLARLAKLSTLERKTSRW